MWSRQPLDIGVQVVSMRSDGAWLDVLDHLTLAVGNALPSMVGRLGFFRGCSVPIRCVLDHTFASYCTPASELAMLFGGYA